MPYTYTTQQEVRAVFWQHLADCRDWETSRLYRVRKRQNDYPADTRCAFVEFVDALQKSGEISEKLAKRVTL